MFVKVAIDEGIKKIRITGREPLLREDLDKFIEMIYDYAPNIDLAMTTNAYLLKSTAQKLKDAELRCINVSIDTLKSEVAQKIAGKDVLANVLEGIEETRNVGLKVKVKYGFYEKYKLRRDSRCFRVLQGSRHDNSLYRVHGK